MFQSRESPLSGALFEPVEFVTPADLPAGGRVPLPASHVRPPDLSGANTVHLLPDRVEFPVAPEELGAE